MLYELRTYEVVPGRMKALVDRFTNFTMGLFEKHGIRSVFYAEPLIGTSGQLVYVLEWNSLAEREERFDAFQRDPAWIAAKAETEKEGPLTLKVNNVILREVPSIMAALRK